MEKEKGYIYIVKLSGYYKIGKSSNFKQRMGEYTRLYEKPKIIILRWCKDYHNLEKKIHKIFHKKQIRGEWFKLYFWELWYAKLIIKLNTALFGEDKRKRYD